MRVCCLGTGKPRILSRLCMPIIQRISGVLTYHVRGCIWLINIHVEILLSIIWEQLS